MDEQCSQLIRRGLPEHERKIIFETLSTINYYRLSAYFLPFQQDKIEHNFKAGVLFKQILNLYHFDTQFRNILMPIIEQAEVLARMRITYHLVTKYKDPFVHTNQLIYTNKFLGRQIAREDLIRFYKGTKGSIDWNLIWGTLCELNLIDRKGNIINSNIDIDALPAEWNNDLKSAILKSFSQSPYDEWIEKMHSSVRESKEEFIRHYLDKYYPETKKFPLWIVSEIISFGQLSKLYAGLNSSDRKAIAAQYNLPHRIFGQWLHSLVYLRNVCAHHSRIWNRELEIRATCPKDLPERGSWSNRVFSLLLVLRYLTPPTMQWNTIIWRLRWLFWNNRFIDIHAMGFPKNWDNILKKVYS